MSIRSDPSLIATDIQNLADVVAPYDKGAANRLHDLGDAVHGGSSAPAWASVELAQLISPRELGERIRQRSGADRFLNMIEFSRNALVFLPIVVTWFGIALAVDAYHNLLQERPELEQRPFLYLWQGGFEGRLDWLTLSRLGLISALLLLVVFLLTVLVLWRGASVQHEAEAAATRVTSHLEHLLAEAALVLRLRYTNQQGVLAAQMEQIGNQLLEQLDQERQRMTALAAARERELADFTAFTGSLKQSTTNLAATAGSIETAYKGLAASINNLAGPTNKMATVTDDLLAAATRLSAPLETLLNDQREQSAKLAAAVTTLATTTTASVSAAKSATAVADRMLQGQTQFLETATADRASQLQASQALDATATRLESAAQLVGKAYNTLAHGIAILTAPTQSLAQQTTALAAASGENLTSLKMLAQEQNAIATHLREISAGLTQTGSEVATAVSEIAAAADTLLGAQSEFLLKLKDEREAQTRLANLVSQSAGNLDQVALLFRELGPTLKAIALDLSYLTSSRNSP